MLFLSVRGFLDYPGPTVHSSLAWLPVCVLLLGMESASGSTGFSQLNSAAHRCLYLPFKKHLTVSPQESKPGWIRYFLSRSRASGRRRKALNAAEDFSLVSKPELDLRRTGCGRGN